MCFFYVLYTQCAPQCSPAYLICNLITYLAHETPTFAIARYINLHTCSWGRTVLLVSSHSALAVLISFENGVLVFVVMADGLCRLREALSVLPQPAHLPERHVEDGFLRGEYGVEFMHCLSYYSCTIDLDYWPVSTVHVLLAHVSICITISLYITRCSSATPYSSLT